MLASLGRSSPWSRPPVRREEAVEDPEAGFTGVPFTQPEHDEE